MQRPLVIDIAGSLAPLFAWLLAYSFIPDIPPLAATGVLLLFGLVFAWRFLVAGGDAGQIERRARSRVRALGPQWPWAIVTAVAMTVLLLAFVSLYSRLVPPPPPSPDNPFDAYIKQPIGWLPFVVWWVAVGPVVEEVIFRGWIQGRLSRDYGPEVAIVTAAALFALGLLDPWEVPHRFLLGLASGYTVYLTRSIWSGVLMHAMFYGGWEAADAFSSSPDDLSALSAGPQGVSRVIAVILAAAAVASFAWRRERVIRDRIAERRAPSAETGPSD